MLVFESTTTGHIAGYADDLNISKTSNTNHIRIELINQRRKFKDIGDLLSFQLLVAPIFKYAQIRNHHQISFQ